MLKPWLRKPLCRLGPLPRSFAADAHDCIMATILTDRPNTRLWRDFRTRWRTPPRICSSGCKTTHVDERRFYIVRRGNDYCDSDCAFAVKPRAFGAPGAASGLDRSAQPSKGVAVPQCHRADVTK